MPLRNGSTASFWEIAPGRNHGKGGFSHLKFSPNFPDPEQKTSASERNPHIRKPLPVSRVFLSEA